MVFFFGSMYCWPCWSGGPVGLLGPWVCRARGSGRPVGLVGLWVWWARGSGGFCWVLNDKSPTLKGSDMPSVLGLVFGRVPLHCT